MDGKDTIFVLFIGLFLGVFLMLGVNVLKYTGDSHIISEKNFILGYSTYKCKKTNELIDETRHDQAKERR